MPAWNGVAMPGVAMPGVAMPPIAGVAMPATSGRIYWNPSKGWFRA